jgi:peptidoglycan/LPS O-acetylase OafA/YrhL
MLYRREIDGLRALAVLPVILFHADFHVFSGGYVGVDIFFVISGYLIASIIIEERAAGSFSISKFYERRIRRIFPALYLVMVVCVPVAWLFLSAPDLKEFFTTVVAVPAFVSNIQFFRQSGYFDTASEFKPLLHTWSLAVEEQYYLIFPWLIILLWKFGKGWIAAGLILAFVGSLALATMGPIFFSPQAAFFLLPFRFWELAIGSALALWLTDGQAQIGSGLANLVSLTGGVLVLYAVFFFEKNTPAPSLYTLAPTIGTALIIAFATPGTYVGRLLGARVLVGLGLISYSAYLWHQPVLAFARHLSLTTLQPNLRISLVMLAFLLGTL